MAYNGNIGFAFYKNYYRPEDSNYFEPRKSANEEKNKKIKEKNKTFFEIKNAVILGVKCNELFTSVNKNDENYFGDNFFKIQLATQYPGLMTGSGYLHETGSEGEFKLGFYFDYTSGQPTIPGSSIKGIVRSYFPSFHLDVSKRRFKDERCLFLYNYLTFQNEYRNYIRVCSDEVKLFVHKLELEIFEGVDTLLTLNQSRGEKSEFEFLLEKNNWKYLDNYHRDSFHDAYIIESKYEGNNLDVGDRKRIFGVDFITPHIDRNNPNMSKFRNPIPLQFLKILPNVTFQFEFALNNNFIPSFQKIYLFQSLLILNGIGAKTNVGYGQLIDPNANPETLIYDKIVEDVSPHYKSTSNTNKPPQNFITDKSKLKQGAIIKGKVTANLNSTLKFDLPDFPGLKCNDFRYGNSNAFSIGSDVSLTIANVSGSYPNILSINVNNPRKF